jgi:hypothetical protein
MYGQTTSGKTYSMLGTSKDPGILPHSMRTIFQEIQRVTHLIYNKPARVMIMIILFRFPI